MSGLSATKLQLWPVVCLEAVITGYKPLLSQQAMLTVSFSSHKGFILSDTFVCHFHWSVSMSHHCRTEMQMNDCVGISSHS